MKRILHSLAVLAFGWAGSANAGLMPSVTVDGREWLQPSDFANLSWNDIGEKCNPFFGGVCSGDLAGYDVTGWTWAGLDEINALFNFFLTEAGISGDDLLTGAEIFAEADSTWAPSFFGPSSFYPFSNGNNNEVQGWLRDLFNNSIAQFARAQDYASADVGDIFSSQGIGLVVENYFSTGAWFYRDGGTPVPTPATLALFGIGLAGLGWSRRKQA